LNGFNNIDQICCMANEPLARNPQTGRMLSRLATQSLQANLAVSQHGQSPEVQALLAEEQTVGMDDHAVQQYITSMFRPLKQWAGNASELAKFIPVIQQLADGAKMDMMLKDTEKKRIEDYAKKLIAFCRAKTTLFARAESAFRNIAKAGREKVADKLGESSSGIFKLAGKLMMPKEEKPTAEKDVKKARSNVLSRLAQVEARDRGTTLPTTHPSYGGYDEDDDDDDEDTERRHALTKADIERMMARRRETTPTTSPRRESVAPVSAPTAPTRVTSEPVGRKKFKTIPEEGAKPKRTKKDAAEELALAGPTPVAIVDTKTSKTQPVSDAGTHTRLDKIIHALSASNEADKQREDASERAQDAAADKGEKPVTTSPVKEKTKGGSLFGALGDLGGMVKNMFSGFSLGGLLGPMLMPAVSALGSGFAIAAAGLAGWELGKWLDGMTGGKLSGGVAKVAGMLMNTGERSEKNQLAGIKGDEVKLKAWKAGMNKQHARFEDFTPAEAQKFLNDKAPAPNVPTPGAAPSAVPAAPSAPTPVPSAQTAPQAIPSTTEPPVSTSPVKVPATQMQVSDEGIAKLKKREGIRKEPYWDVTGWAIGFGDHEFRGQTLGTDRSRKPNVKMTDGEADAALRHRVATHYAPLIRRNLGTKQVNQNEFDALVSVAYNSEAAGARLARRSAHGDVLKKEDFTASGTVHGKPVAELQARRGAEFEQFTSPGRASSPVQALTAANRAAQQSLTVNAPVVTTVASNSGQAPVVVPVPMTAENPDQTVRALRSANVT
jgi:GH24 family phage-related lysozyme (muramidase)